MTKKRDDSPVPQSPVSVIISTPHILITSGTPAQSPLTTKRSKSRRIVRPD